MSDPTPQEHIKALDLEVTQATNPMGRPDRKDVLQAIRWALPILRAYAIRKMTTPPTKNTPGSNIHNLKMLATGESVAWDLAETALQWALPILEVSMVTPEERESVAKWIGQLDNIMSAKFLGLEEGFKKAESMLRVSAIPESSQVTSTEREEMARRLEKQAHEETPPDRELLKMAEIIRVPNATRFSRQEREMTVEWVRSIMRDLRPRLRSEQEAAFERAIAMILAPAHERWTGPEAIRARESAHSDREAIKDLGKLANFLMDHSPSETTKGESVAETAIRLLSAPPQSSESMREHAKKLRAIADELTGGSTKIRDALREAAMIIQGTGISFEELAKLERFIEEKFPGELDGMPPATVAIRLLSAQPSSEAPTQETGRHLLAKRLASYAGSLERNGGAPGTARLENTVATMREAAGILSLKTEPLRLPTLDASQIPVTRDLALEVLRGFLATIQRDYPYAPNPSPEQWATTREAMMFVLADEAQREKAWEELGAIRDLFLAIPGETALQSSQRVMAALSQARSDADMLRRSREASESYLAEAMRVLGIAAPYPATQILRTVIEGMWIKKCRPGTMNTTPNRCDACTAPCGTVHLPIPEAPTDGLRVLANQYLDQRDAAWKELGDIRKAIGANPEESTLDEVTRLLAIKQQEQDKWERCSEGCNVVGPYQCRTCCALPGNPHNPESVTTRYAPMLHETMDMARRGERPHRERLPLLASALDLALSAMGRSIIVTETTDTAEEMTESESYGWAHQAIRPMVRAQTEVHVREQVLDLVASAVREAWARRRFAERGPGKA